MSAGFLHALAVLALGVNWKLILDRSDLGYLCMKRLIFKEYIKYDILETKAKGKFEISLLDRTRCFLGQIASGANQVHFALCIVRYVSNGISRQRQGKALWRRRKKRKYKSIENGAKAVEFASLSVLNRCWSWTMRKRPAGLIPRSVSIVGFAS